MENLELMKKRARALNNDRQIERMVQDKLKSLHRALLYSYQSAWIRKEGTEEYHRALINPDKIKFDYDEKIVSIDPRWGYQTGDVFEWKNTGTRWLILKQELTEVAYFRGNCRRCQEVEATDPETGKKVSFWAAIRGPVETKINTVQKRDLVVDIPNLTLNMYVSKTEQTMRIFKRYSKFNFMDQMWEVTAPDAISTPGILEFTAIETYNCDHTDIVLNIKDPNENQSDNEDGLIITGDTFITPLQSYTYTINNLNANYNWEVALPSMNKDIEDVLEYEILEDGSLKISWTAMMSGSFVIRYGSAERTVVVQSLF